MRIKIALLLALAALLALFAAGSAQAALTVSNQNDSGAGSLRQTIAEAGPGETINLPAGTYSLTSGPLKIEKKSLTLLGHDDADTTIRAAGAFRVIEFFGPLDATISGVTIRDGSIVATVAFGAGIFDVESNLTLRDVVVTNNTANVNGALGSNGGVAEGVGVWVAEGSLNLVDSKVTGNTATAVGGSGSNGGVILGAGVWVAEGAATVTNSTIAGNRADAGGGQGGPPGVGQRGGVGEAGGIWVGEGPLSLRDSVVSGNTVLANSGPGDHGGVAEGGGVWVGTGDLTIANSTINSNRADAEGGQGPADKEQRGGVSEGGGIWLGEGVLSVLNTEISGNSASSVGGPGGNGGVVEAGGLWAVPSGPQASSILGSTVAGNTINGSAGAGGSNGVVEGGGIWLATEEGPLSMTRTTIANNVARHQATTGGVAQGGGIWMVGAKSGSVTLLSTTIAANRLEAAAGPSNEGGNIFWAEKVTIRNSIVANGAGPPGSENCSEPEPPELPSLGFNLDSLDQCGFKAPGDRVNASPQLGPLQLNGGQTLTMIPAATGAAVDQGVASGLASDQRGVVRPIDLPSIPNNAAPGADGADIGAVEFQPSNAFALGKLTRNKKKGTATLSVILPSPSAGTLTLTGNGLATQTLSIAGQTEVQLKVAASSKKIKKALRKKGKRKVGINVTYAPPGNSATTQSSKAKLVKKKRKHKKKHRKPGKR